MCINTYRETIQSKPINWIDGEIKSIKDSTFLKVGERCEKLDVLKEFKGKLLKII